jgi:hypothetical protein
LLPILEKAANADISGIVGSVLPKANIGLSISGGGEGEYEGCEEKGKGTGVVEGVLTASLSIGTGEFRYTQRRVNGGTPIVREAEATPLEIGAAGPANLKIQKMTASEFLSDWEAMLVIFAKSKVRFGPIDWELIDITVPLLQDRGKVNVPYS